MLLSARPLENVIGVNDYEVVSTISFVEGDVVSLFFQLIDLVKDRPEQGFIPAGRRYMPVIGATLQITFDNIDDAKIVIKVATQPFTQDASIWRVDVMATDTVKGTVNAKLLLTEGVVARRAVLPAVLRIRSA